MSALSETAEDVMGWLLDHTIPLFVILLILAVGFLIIVAPFALYAESQKPTFALKKDSWQCSASHVESSTTYVKTGDVLMPITSHTKVCDQWSVKP